MDFKIDIHTHTIASGHAYSTLEENIRAASQNGIEILGITDHSWGMDGGAEHIYFMNYRAIPRLVNGVRLMMGVEANIMDYEGKLDMEDQMLSEMDIVIASLHSICIKFGNIDENTNACIKAMENENVNILGHPGDPRYPLDIQELVKTSIKTNTFLEINNASLNPNGFRKGSRDNIVEILKLTRKLDYPVIAGSDAHFSASIGGFQLVQELFEEISFPKELVLNTSVKDFERLITVKKHNK